MFPRVACKYVDITVTATLGDGSPAALAGADVAVVRAGDSPDDTTAWTAAEYTQGVASVLLAGPQYDNPPLAAIVVAEPGGDLWARVVDQPETDAAWIDRIVLV